MALTIDETPAGPGEWGFRPENTTTEETHHRHLCGARRRMLRAMTSSVRGSQDFSKIAYEARELTYTVHRAAEVFESGQCYWRFRFADGDGQVSEWSSGRAFVIAQNASALPLPKRSELIGRIPKSHPRLFLRPEDLDSLRARARGDLKPIYDDLVATCEDCFGRYAIHQGTAPVSRGGLLF